MEAFELIDKESSPLADAFSLRLGTDLKTIHVSCECHIG